MMNWIKNSKIYIPIFLIILFFISYLRSPDIFSNGRFWGEDGVVYFQHAIKNSFFDNFFKIYTPTSGYYNLFPRIVALISSKFNLEYAPLVNNYLCYLIIIYIFFIILFNASFLYKKTIEKFIYCILILVCPTLIPEVWLNSVNAQIYLSICGILILYLKDNTKLIFKKINLLVIFIGGFSSIYVFLLTPFFFIKYLIFKNKYNLLNFLILLMSACFQLFFYIYSKIYDKMIIRDVSEGLNLSYIYTFFYNSFLKLFFPREFIINLYSITTSNKTLIPFALVLIIIILIFSVFIFYKIIKKNYVKIPIIISLMAILFSVLFVIIVFSGESLAGRYAALPGFLITLLIFHVAFYKYNNNFYKNYFVCLSLLILFTGFHEYRPNDTYRIQYLDCINNCKSWKTQVETYKINTLKNELIIWPYNIEDDLSKFEYKNIIKMETK
jgi:hypothetical protein